MRSGIKSREVNYYVLIFLPPRNNGDFNADDSERTDELNSFSILVPSPQRWIFHKTSMVKNQMAPS